jgi:protein SCO1
MLSKIRIILWTLVAFSTAGFVVLYLANERRIAAPSTIATPMMPFEGDFKLTTQKGEIFTAANLLEKPSVLFFGFTNCPDICPTGLSELTELLAKLGDSSDKLQVLFVAVDSRRDTQAIVREYLTSFDPRIIGLTGSTDEIDLAVKTFKAFYEIVPGTGPDDYTVNHSAGMYLIDKEKRFIGKLDSHESLEVRLTKLRRLVGN